MVIGYIVDTLVSLGLGFIGGFVVMKYKTSAATQIQSAVNDVTATVEQKVDQAVTAVQTATKS